MEQMIPELEDLEERGFFTKAEIKRIVTKREQFEYLLKRPAPVKGDFYRSGPPAERSVRLSRAVCLRLTHSRSATFDGTCLP